ncbi:flavin reductase [Micromonospora sp. NPDC023956]|uniref:flavin reductase n=1 Tax=Micromonospora sp. NPDC023956 TaxID=3155722 RepID=UPI0033FC803E
MPLSLPGRDHVAARPCWRCKRCGAPWPCQPAKLYLLGLYADNRLGLSMYLGEVMAVAASELPDDGTNIIERFVSWARPPRRPQT